MIQSPTLQSYESFEVNAQELADRWWTLSLRGLVAIAFGLLCLISPARSMLGLIALFAVHAFFDGVANLAMAARGREHGERWGSLVFEGIVSLVACGVALFWPTITAWFVIAVIATWSIVIGIARVATAVRLRRQIRGEWVLAMTGGLSIAIGVLLFTFPRAAEVALVTWLGIWSLVFGSLFVGLGLRLRAWGRRAAPRGMARVRTLRVASRAS